MGHVWGRGEVHTGFWWGKLRQTGYLEDLDVDGMIMLKLMLEKQEETSGTVFEIDQWVITFHTMQGISGLALTMLDSQEGLCCMVLVGWLVDWLVG
jgi:hypothetical protein